MEGKNHMAKNKLAPVTIANRVHADAALSQMGRLNGIIAKYAKAEAKIMAKREEAEHLQAEYERAVIGWAKKDCKTWEGKSLRLVNGAIFFQVSPGKVGVIKGVVKSLKDAVVLLSKSRRAWAAQFVRVKPPVLNGEVLIQEFIDGRITNEQLAEVGLRVEKPEVCRIEVF